MLSSLGGKQFDCSWSSFIYADYLQEMPDACLNTRTIHVPFIKGTDEFSIWLQVIEILRVYLFAGP